MRKPLKLQDATALSLPIIYKKLLLKITFGGIDKNNNQICVELISIIINLLFFFKSQDVG